MTDGRSCFSSGDAAKPPDVALGSRSGSDGEDEDAANSADWLILVRPDGVIDDVEGGAPVDWIGRALTDIPDIDEDVTREGLGLLTAPARTRYVRRATASFRRRGARVTATFLVIEGIPVRRAYTRVDDLVSHTLDLFLLQASSNGIELSIKRANDTPPVLYIDGEKIAWALATLIGNAFRFASGRREGARGGRVEESRARWLFERDPSTGKAAGLALVMVRDVVTAHRGTVHVESAVDRGTTVTMRIPRVHASAP